MKDFKGTTFDAAWTPLTLETLQGAIDTINQNVLHTPTLLFSQTEYEYLKRLGLL